MIRPKPLTFHDETGDHEYGALSPYISSDTLRAHYEKHYKGYIKNLNKLIKGTVHEGSSLEDIVTSSAGPIFNNAAQVYNHEFYFNCLTNEDTTISDKLKSAIASKWGSLDEFKTFFSDRAGKIFGSGWAWLVWNVNEEGLQIMTTPNAFTPISPEDGYSSKYVPIMTCDVWEHAYYLDQKNDRAAYLKAFWEVVNWDFISKQYGQI